MTRQLRLALGVRFPRPAVPGRTLLEPSVTTLRVTPADLDMYLHVNNGVYLQMMDMARTNLLADLGALPLLAQRGWYPVVVATTMTYRRSLRLGQRFTITSRVLGWDPRVVYLDQVFERDGEHVARGVVAGRFLARGGGRVAAPDVAALLGHDGPSPAVPAQVSAWADAFDVAHRPA
ncbi:thioesterase family protein [Actinotalea sp. JY-7876]|uniref:acyl-CoA thioesterase n=2 Tax=unclassified Actinotalea TaxID=2638618 RepID=UPI0015F3D2F2|nr:acyl-CoA thioesterase [Actinotalea sp. JY-7876]